MFTVAGVARTAPLLVPVLLDFQPVILQLDVNTNNPNTQLQHFCYEHQLDLDKCQLLDKALADVVDLQRFCKQRAADQLPGFVMVKNILFSHPSAENSSCTWMADETVNIASDLCWFLQSSKHENHYDVEIDAVIATCTSALAAAFDRSFQWIHDLKPCTGAKSGTDYASTIGNSGSAEHSDRILSRINAIERMIAALKDDVIQQENSDLSVNDLRTSIVNKCYAKQTTGQCTEVITDNRNEPMPSEDEGVQIERSKEVLTGIDIPSNALETMKASYNHKSVSSSLVPPVYLDNEAETSCAADKGYLQVQYDGKCDGYHYATSISDQEDKSAVDFNANTEDANRWSRDDSSDPDSNNMMDDFKMETDDRLLKASNNATMDDRIMTIKAGTNADLISMQREELHYDENAAVSESKHIIQAESKDSHSPGIEFTKQHKARSIVDLRSTLMKVTHVDEQATSPAKWVILVTMILILCVAFFCCDILMTVMRHAACLQYLWRRISQYVWNIFGFILSRREHDNSVTNYEISSVIDGAPSSPHKPKPLHAATVAGYTIPTPASRTTLTLCRGISALPSPEQALRQQTIVLQRLTAKYMERLRRLAFSTWRLAPPVEKTSLKISQTTREAHEHNTEQVDGDQKQLFRPPSFTCVAMALMLGRHSLSFHKSSKTPISAESSVQSDFSDVSSVLDENEVIVNVVGQGIGLQQKAAMRIQRIWKMTHEKIPRNILDTATTRASPGEFTSSEEQKPMFTMLNRNKRQVRTKRVGMRNPNLTSMHLPPR